MDILPTKVVRQNNSNGIWLIMQLLCHQMHHPQTPILPSNTVFLIYFMVKLRLKKQDIQFLTKVKNPEPTCLDTN